MKERGQGERRTRSLPCTADLTPSAQQRPQLRPRRRHPATSAGASPAELHWALTVDRLLRLEGCFDDRTEEGARPLADVAQHLRCFSRVNDGPLKVRFSARPRFENLPHDEI